MERASIETVEMDELLNRGMGTLLYDGACGRIVRNEEGGVLVSNIEDGATLHRIVMDLHLRDCDQFCVKSAQAADYLCKAYDFSIHMACTLAVYDKPEVPPMPHADIRPLREADLPLASKHYHLWDDTLDYLTERLQAGRLWGLYEDGKLAGFIGMHSEGSVGMLEILPEYRRRGLGTQLENYLIRLHLQRGWKPFCHIVEGNAASIRLQEKLGFSFGKQPSIWVY
ncbi:MAG: GNAT family N-acetyltransferase [Oscillospiraceae bacterium]|jgi:tRNA (guanine37-N1)-methyltransferase|nr:GNAT family N-acetyltransferase [Oscillospiraceae bacterium]